MFRKFRAAAQSSVTFRELCVATLSHSVTQTNVFSAANESHYVMFRKLCAVPESSLCCFVSCAETLSPSVMFGLLFAATRRILLM